MAPRKDWRTFEDHVADVLRQQRIPFERDVAIGGLHADFVVHGPDNRVVVIEAKSWPKRPGFKADAAEQAKLLKQAVGADSAILVLDNLDRSSLEDGVVTVAKLPEAVHSALKQPRQRKKPMRPSKKPKRTVFAAMPFSVEYEDVFYVAMVPAADAVGAVCRRVDLEDFEGDVVEEIRRLIRRSVAVIADLSASRPNVLYEAGYAHALKRPTIPICSTDVDDLPFNVRNWNVIEYSPGQTHRLAKRLVTRLKHALAK